MVFRFCAALHLIKQLEGKPGIAICYSLRIICTAHKREKAGYERKEWFHREEIMTLEISQYHAKSAGCSKIDSLITEHAVNRYRTKALEQNMIEILFWEKVQEFASVNQKSNTGTLSFLPITTWEGLNGGYR